MADLRLVGLSDDGERLILERDGGEQEHLLVDDRLRAVLTTPQQDESRHQPKPQLTPLRPQPNGETKQMPLDLESKLTPREIQSMIRSGHTLEEVADEAGVSVERVERFAGPILHEREYIAQEAAKVSVRRDEHGAVMLLGELVGQRLEQRGVPREGMQWDAWRRQDGGWEVRVDYLAGNRERSALWVYDPKRRTVTPDDDEARWLLEEETAASVTPLRPVADDAVGEPEATAQPSEPLPSQADTGVAQSAAQRGRARHRKGTQDAIDTLMRGRETVPDTPAPKRKKKPTVPSWDEILFGSKKPE